MYVEKPIMLFIGLSTNIETFSIYDCVDCWAYQAEYKYIL